MTNPIDLLNQWLIEERERGAPDPQQAVLSTATKEGIPHNRVVAIREITSQSLLFFTQRGSRKVAELRDNPHAAMAFWFELFEREVIIEGIIEALPEAENNQYWMNYPRKAQIRFYSYAATSSQVIASKQALEDKRKNVEHDYHHKPLPLSPFYCGFRLKPAKMLFYTYRTDELSDVIVHHYNNNEWSSQLMSP